MLRIGDVDQEAMAAARAGQQAERRVGGDVMAIPGTGRRPSTTGLTAATARRGVESVKIRAPVTTSAASGFLSGTLITSRR